jgi:branched-chain amino acid transport system permease protein
MSTFDSIRARANAPSPLSALWRRVPGEAPLPAAATLLLVAILFAAPWLFSYYTMSQLRDALLFALLALGLDFLWGKTGLLSFGHAAFFGAGAYGVAVISLRGGLDPAAAAWAGLAVGIALAALVSLVVGYFLIYSGVRGPYFTIVTLALSVIAEHIVVGWSRMTGGNAGLLGVPPLQFPSPDGWTALSPNGQYVLVAGVVCVTAFGIRALCRRRYGMVLLALQDNELRARALGHDTSLQLLVVFVASAAIAALGGGLYATTVGFVAPDSIGLLLSTQAVVWVAIGGRGTLVGPVMATLLVIGLEQKVSSFDTKLWPLIIGALFILTVFVFPDGILPRLGQFAKRWHATGKQEQPR